MPELIGIYQVALLLALGYALGWQWRRSGSADKQADNMKSERAKP